MLNRLLADVFVFTDHMSGPEAGLSPGYGVTLVAETTTGRHISAEAVAAAENMVHRFSNPGFSGEHLCTWTRRRSVGLFPAGCVS